MKEEEKEEGVFRKMSKGVKAAIGIIALTAAAMELSAQGVIIDFNDMELVLVEAGSFNTGGEGADGTDVTLTEDYYIGRYEVTQAQYVAVMEVENPSFNQGDDLPVEQVNWYNANAFATKIGGKLPTEAQWEFAARGGKNSKGYIYSGSDNADDVAWYSYNCISTQPVGTKATNELGIYDMSGNVSEWVNDYYSSTYPSGETAPTGPTTGSSRVSRGGGWDYDATDCRVADRLSDTPSNGYSDLGFRVCFPLNSINSKTITLETNGSIVEVNDFSVLQGARIIQLSVLSKEGFVFTGLYKEATFENEWDFENDVVEDDMTLFAKWECAEHDFTQLGTQISAANCTTPAKHKAKCSVGSEESETLVLDGAAALGHSAITGTWTGTTATCENASTRVEKCTRCDVNIATDTQAALGHDYTVFGAWDTTKVATPTEDGSRTRTVACSRDNTYFSANQTEPIAKLGAVVAINDINKANAKTLFKSTIVSDKMEINLGNEFRDVKFVVYDMTGNVVYSSSATTASATWDLRNKMGRFVANRSYLVVVEARDKSGKQVRYSAKLGVKR